MVTNKAIFEGRLKNAPINCGRLSCFKNRRTDWFIDLWKRDIIQFESLFRGENGASFVAQEGIKIIQPRNWYQLWLNKGDEKIVKKGQVVMLGSLNLVRLLTYYQERRNAS